MNLQQHTEAITVLHPEYGHVVFDKPTIRQRQILELYNKLFTDAKLKPARLYPGIPVQHVKTGETGIILDQNSTGVGHWTVQFDSGVVDRVYQEDLIELE